MYTQEYDEGRVSALNTIVQRFIHTLRTFDYEKYEHELDLTAQACFDSVLMVGIVVTALSVTVQGIFGRLDVFGEDVALLFYWVVLGAGRQLYIRHHLHYIRLAIYLAQVPPLFFSIMMGTFWDPEGQAISFLFVIMVLPVLLVDRPIRIMVWTTGWTGIFILCCYLAKDRAVFGPDMVHLSSFFAGSIALSMYLLAYRLDNIESRERAEYLTTHEGMSKLKNRNLLAKDMPNYLNKLIFVMNLEVDGYREIMNFCGIPETERLWKIFADTVCSVFPADQCYKLATGQILTVLSDVQEDEVREMVLKVQKELSAYSYGAHKEPVTCSAGYVYGDARGQEDFMEMIRHAALKLVGGMAVGTIRMIGGYNDRALK